MKYNPEIHHRCSIRLKGYDYSQAGLYFITLCSQNRQHFFGKIQDDKMNLNEAGEMIFRQWLDLENRFPKVKLHEFVVMPNHFHGIIEFTEDEAVRADLYGCPEKVKGQKRDGQPQGFAPTGLEEEKKKEDVRVNLYGYPKEPEKGQPQGFAPTGFKETEKEEKEKDVRVSLVETPKAVRVNLYGYPKEPKEGQKREGQPQGFAPTGFKETEKEEKEKDVRVSLVETPKDVRVNLYGYPKEPEKGQPQGFAPTGFKETEKEEKEKDVRVSLVETPKAVRVNLYGYPKEPKEGQKRDGQPQGFAPTGFKETEKEEKEKDVRVSLVETPKAVRVNLYGYPKDSQEQKRDGQPQGFAPTGFKETEKEEKEKDVRVSLVETPKAVRVNLYGYPKEPEKGQPQGFAPTSRNSVRIGDVVGAFKSLSTHEYIQNVRENNWLPFNKRLWQRNFFEHIIRNEKSYFRISEYIKTNPMKWQEDRFYE